MYIVIRTTLPTQPACGIMKWPYARVPTPPFKTYVLSSNALRHVCFINFHIAQDVVLGLEGVEGAGSELECFRDGEKLVVTHLLFRIQFLNSLGPNF